MKLTPTIKRNMTMGILLILGAYHSPIIGNIVKNVLEAPFLGTLNLLIVSGVMAIILAYFIPEVLNEHPPGADEER